MRRDIARRIAIFSFLGLASTTVSHAQSQSISGIVKDEDNKMMSRTSILNLNGRVLGLTKENGSFQVHASQGDTLLFNSVGFKTDTVVVNSDFLNVVMTYKTKNEDEVVVVAMDMKRNPRELGYSVQTVKGSDIKNSQEENFINSLQGRVAGVTVTPTNGQAGASSQIILRGFNSASLNNQPLFVIDGVIMDNSTFNETSNGGSGIGLADDGANRNTDYTNRMSDVNPDDIASLTVLKGPEATALYGSQASSGAIVITTKHAGTGSGVHVNYDNSFRFDKITRFPSIVNDYSPGANGVDMSNTFSYFGAPLASGVKKYDNIGNFFQTGFANSQNISADWGTKNVGFRLSGSYFDNSGIIPNNYYKRYNVKLANTLRFFDNKLVIRPTVSFINSTNRKPMRGSNGYLLSLFAWPITDNAEDYQDQYGNKRLLYASTPNAELEDNPFFSAYRNYGKDKTNRWMSTLGVDYNPTDWLAIAGRFGYDTYNQDGFNLTDPQSSSVSTTYGGQLSNYYLTYKGYNHTITATAKKKVGKFSGRVMVGTMWQNYQTTEYALYGNKLLDASNTMSHSTDSSNIGTVQSRLQQNYEGLPNEKTTRQIAYFTEVSIGYDNKLFLSGTYRWEAASVFPKRYRNYNYPGVSLSAIMSDILPGVKGSFLNYWKLRASTANTARLMDPYMNQSVFVNNYASSNDPNHTYSYSYYNNNPYLKPERQNTFEVGTEFRFLRNRVTLEAAYYNTHNTDQISQGYRASYGTGFILNTQNATASRNQGVEITMNVVPVKTNDFNWNIQFNFNHMWNKVLAIPASIDGYSDYYISDTWIYGNTRGGFVRGYPTTELTGYSYQRNDKGEILINPNTGLPLVNTKFSPIGNRNPKFRLGTVNTLSYKNWNLSFLWDLRVGGDIFNATDMYLTSIGKSSRTADRYTPRVVKGVLADGLQNSANPTQNNIVVTPAYNNLYYSETNGMPDEEFVQKNINSFRLRNVTLSYQFPKALVSKWRFVKNVGVFATGNNLLLFTNYHGADPDVNGNTAGTAGVGGFGMDYGNVALPVSYNFGLRAQF